LVRPVDTMSAPITDFDTAAEAVKVLRVKPDDNTLLELYGLYKQATVGDIDIPQPWSIQFEAAAKWAAWNLRKGMSSADAKAAYVAKVNELIRAES